MEGVIGRNAAKIALIEEKKKGGWWGRKVGGDSPLGLALGLRLFLRAGQGGGKSNFGEG